MKFKKKLFQEKGIFSFYFKHTLAKMLDSLEKHNW